MGKDCYQIILLFWFFLLWLEMKLYELFVFLSKQNSYFRGFYGLT